ncbi:MAG TPA: hypothetical protein VGR37_19400 [Longimicrobiaceae bacterium]|nr:hypothetical protein [Longimicrobiaceae bacterium]
MSSFQTYLLGFIIVVIGLAAGAYMLNVPGVWIGIGVVVLIGIGILSATSRTKPRDPQYPDDTGRTPGAGPRRPY